MTRTEMMVAKWADFRWPDWVPAELRRQIESFWGCFSRTPMDWVRNWTKDYPYAPDFGEVANLRVSGPGDNRATGRYIHAWNNMGRVVFPDGSYEVVYLTHYVPTWGGRGHYA